MLVLVWYPHLRLPRCGSLAHSALLFSSFFFFFIMVGAVWWHDKSKDKCIHSHTSAAFCLICGFDTGHCLLQPIRTPLPVWNSSCSSCDGLKVLTPPPVIVCCIYSLCGAYSPCPSSPCCHVPHYVKPFSPCLFSLFCDWDENAYSSAWHAACITKPLYHSCTFVSCYCWGDRKRGITSRISTQINIF